MWNTASLLQAADKTVLDNGELVPINHSPDQTVFTFEPIQISCNKKGITDWELASSSKNRFIFRIKKLQYYQQAMIKALKHLLIV